MDQRMYLPTLSELIDRLSVTQIKLNLANNDPKDFQNEIKKINNDIDLIMREKKLQLDSEFVNLILVIAQLNLHIWHNKDLMQQNLDNEDQYLALLKKAHQLNGYRNQIKNRILDIEGIEDKSQIRSNFETDGLNINLGL